MIQSHAESTGIVQVVDTLEVGGLERLAVNVAGALTQEGYRSYLCTTRKEGPLVALVDPAVGRLRLGRSTTFDLRAFLRFRTFIKEHDISVLHAHGSALYLAAMVRSTLPAIRLVWHVHYGEFARQSKVSMWMGWALGQVDAVLAVNKGLLAWVSRIAPHFCGPIAFVPNFVQVRISEAARGDLPGLPGFRLVCVANFRPEKDHLTLLQAMALLKAEEPRAHLILVGEARDQEYAATVMRSRAALGLERSVTLLGTRDDVADILGACTIAVISSQTEGLPMSLLEYGMAPLPVVATAVGEIPEVLGHGTAGILVPPADPVALARQLKVLLDDAGMRSRLGKDLRARVEKGYSREAAMATIARTYSDVLATGRTQRTLA